jgi:thiol:disulfide interchange protein DsbD
MCRPALIFLTVLTLTNSPSFAADSLDQLVRNAAALKLNLFSNDLLKPDEAFEFSATLKNETTLSVNWEIAPTYYLYREKIKLELVGASGVKLGDFSIPKGAPKQDEAFGDVEIFHGNLKFDAPLFREKNAAKTVTLRASFQGCAERGVCYPPMKKDVLLELR